MAVAVSVIFVGMGYATGMVDGGGGDRVGGLVGENDGGTITASYASGAVDGGDGDSDYVGGLVGRRVGGTFTASYGFGTKTGGEIVGSIPVDRSGDASPAGTVANAAQITQANSSTATPAGTNDWSTTVWNFSTGTRRPFLRWVTASNFSCDANLLLSGQSCGGIIPGQTP